MIPTLVSERSNCCVQTEVGYLNPNEKPVLKLSEEIAQTLQEPELNIDFSDVQGIIPPLVIGKNGVIQRNKIPRLFKHSTAPIIRTLLTNIQENPNAKDKLIRSLAVKMIPEIFDPNYSSLYTNPIKKIYKTVEGKLKIIEGGQPEVQVTAMFALNGMMYIENEKNLFSCKTELWEKLTPGKEINIIRDDKSWAVLTVLDEVDPVLPKTVPACVLENLCVSEEKELKTLLTKDDISFIDVILSIPSLTSDDANDLMMIMHHRGLLYPYVRSKVCKILLDTPLKEKEWPELLGRLIFLLDPKWCFTNASLLKRNDAMSVLRHIKNLNGGALYALQTALSALKEIKGSDVVLFMWNLIFLCILPNATYGNKEHGAELKKKMDQMWIELKKKKPESRTRSTTQESIDFVMSLKEFDLNEPICTEDNFFGMILATHLDEVLSIFELIPYGKEESSPLFYPVVLAIEAALQKAAAKDVSESMMYDSESIVSLGQLSENQMRIKVNETNKNQDPTKKQISGSQFAQKELDSQSSEAKDDSDSENDGNGQSVEFSPIQSPKTKK